jgi:choline-glycine betaine transporter
MWRRWPWNVLFAAPLLLLASSLVLAAVYPDCGHADAPPCVSNWVYEWQGYLYVLGMLAILVLVVALAVRWARKLRRGARHS